MNDHFERSCSQYTRRVLPVLVAAPAAFGAAAAAAAQGWQGQASEQEARRVEVCFAANSPGEAGAAQTVRGALYLPPGRAHCRGVQLALHGFSHASYVWDLPGRPGYSYARYMAARGYPVMAIDLLGYGRSDRPTGTRSPTTATAR